MSEMRYDVVVVGAGPAGSRTAKLCADNNLNVLLVEKRQEIGIPVRCGEGVSKIKMKEIGVDIPRECIAQEIDGARIFSPEGEYILLSDKIAGNEVGCNIYRDVFDKHLAKEAGRAGADIMVKSSVVSLLKDGKSVSGVNIKTMNETVKVKSDIVVGADGFESQIGRWADIDTSLKPCDIISCLQYTMTNISFDERINDFYVGSVAPGGYAWVFPRDDEANVGLGIQLGLIKNRGAVKNYLDKFVTKCFPEGKIVRVIAGAVSVCQPIDCTVNNNILLVGDAARLIDPITGGGIVNACLSAKIASDVIVEAFEKHDFSKKMLMKYDKGWRNELEDKHYRNWKIKEILSRLSDDILNKCVRALKGYNFERISTIEIIKAVEQRYPEMLKEMKGLI